MNKRRAKVRCLAALRACRRRCVTRHWILRRRLRRVLAEAKLSTNFQILRQLRQWTDEATNGQQDLLCVVGNDAMHGFSARGAEQADTVALLNMLRGPRPGDPRARIQHVAAVPVLLRQDRLCARGQPAREGVQEMHAVHAAFSQQSTGAGAQA